MLFFGSFQQDVYLRSQLMFQFGTLKAYCPELHEAILINNSNSGDQGKANFLSYIRVIVKI
ncbi:hypothetical protein D3C87_1737050 [compost metagenome]